MVSATECAPSASIAAEWPISPAPSFATAMAKFAAMAAYTVFLLSLATGRSQPEVGPDPDEGPGPDSGLDEGPGSAGPGPASGPCHSTRPASAPPTRPGRAAVQGLAAIPRSSETMLRTTTNAASLRCSTGLRRRRLNGSSPA